MAENTLCNVHKEQIKELQDSVHRAKNKLQEVSSKVDVINERVPVDLRETLVNLNNTMENMNETFIDIKNNLIPRGEYTMIKNFVFGLVGLISLTVGAALLSQVIIK